MSPIHSSRWLFSIICLGRGWVNTITFLSPATVCSRLELCMHCIIEYSSWVLVTKWEFVFQHTFRLHYNSHKYDKQMSSSATVLFQVSTVWVGTGPLPSIYQSGTVGSSASAFCSTMELTTIYLTRVAGLHCTLLPDAAACLFYRSSHGHSYITTSLCLLSTDQFYTNSTINLGPA